MIISRLQTNCQKYISIKQTYHVCVCVYKDLMMAFETVTGGRFKEIFIEQKITNINLGHSKMEQNKLKKKKTHATVTYL